MNRAMIDGDDTLGRLGLTDGRRLTSRNSETLLEY